ncbi:PST family polysaccharide transporter [Granulicella aggregans]|uniref:PST family polysaccharide transporter n=1 Tax=Granulicella aggregans TaxID=474949 RepID=A0A7W8E372_9BACT|nr:flippase [Granulicella aggregans]MBB5057287.1 PST family polysaccharide transporter [Granulicella aggregans]
MQWLRERGLLELNRVGPGLRKIIENMGWLLVDRFVRMGMGLFVGVWVARYLGPAQFGSLNFALAFIALFTTATTLGLEGILVRELLHNPRDTDEMLGTTLALRTGGGLLSVALSIATVKFIQPHDQQALILVSILSFNLIFQAFDTIDSFFQSEVKSKITVWAKNLAFLLFAGIRVSLIHVRAPLWTFAASYAGEIAFGALFLTLGYRLSGGRIFAWRVSKARAMLLLKESWPVIFSGMAIMVYMRIDAVMLKVMQGDLAVGLYSAATRVSEVWYFIPTAIVSSVSPAIIRAKDDPTLFYGRLRKLFSMMTITACVIGAIVALASHAIIRTLYASSYSGAAPVLAVHVWASVFVFLGVAQSPWDLSKNLLSLSLYRTFSGAIINIVMNLYLIPRYSAMGAAIATVVSYAISSVFANALSARTRPIFFMQMKSFLPYRFWI